MSYATLEKTPLLQGYKHAHSVPRVSLLVRLSSVLAVLAEVVDLVIDDDEPAGHIDSPFALCVKGCMKPNTPSTISNLSLNLYHRKRRLLTEES